MEKLSFKGEAAADHGAVCSDPIYKSDLCSKDVLCIAELLRAWPSSQFLEEAQSWEKAGYPFPKLYLRSMPCVRAVKASMP